MSLNVYETMLILHLLQVDGIDSAREKGHRKTGFFTSYAPSRALQLYLPAFPWEIAYPWSP